METKSNDTTEQKEKIKVLKSNKFKMPKVENVGTVKSKFHINDTWTQKDYPRLETSEKLLLKAALKQEIQSYH